MTTTARILLVEDDPAQASLFSSVLQMKGYMVVTAHDADAGLAQLTESTFELTLVDWDLPGMKGDTFISTVAAQYPQVCTVLFSNHYNVEAAAKACGADAWMLKSDGILRLREIIAGLLVPA